MMNDRFNPTKQNYIRYTVLFFIITIIISFIFIFYQKSPIWVGGAKDGLDQHFTSLMYYGKYLRGIIKNIFIYHQFSIPLWDFSIGYGGDILTTLHYYVLGDPLTLLSIFVPMKYTEYLYIFLILLRYYLIGLSFMTYCHFMDKKSWSTILGTITYTFCGFSLFAGVRHPYFLNPMIYLPLLFIGIEKIFQKKSSILFIIMIFISAVSNFYFFYMISIIIFIYTTFRFFHYFHQNYIKNIFIQFSKYTILYILGLALSATIFIPTVNMFFNTARSQYDTFIPLLYDINYYHQLIINFIGEGTNGNWTFTNFSAISFFCIILLFIGKKKNNNLTISFLLLTLFLCIPVMGSVFNGFGYITNRWCFAYALLVSYIVVCKAPELLTLNKHQFYTLNVILIIYAIYLFYHLSLKSIVTLIIPVIILITLLSQLKYHYSIQKLINILTICTVFSICVHSYLRFSLINGEGYIKEFIGFNQAYSEVSQYCKDVLDKINDSQFYRYDTNIQNSLYNASLITNKNPISFFYSLGNKYISEHLINIASINTLSSMYKGLDYRSSQLSLSSTKYLIVQKNQQDQRIPYGFKKMKDMKNFKYEVYYNDNVLPLGFTYNQYMIKEHYDQLSSLSKQSVLLDRVILDKKINLKEKISYAKEIINEFNIIDNKNIEIQDEKIIVRKNNASFKLKYQLYEDQETYLFLKGLKLDMQSNDFTRAEVIIQGHNINQPITLYSPLNSYYNGQSDFLCHLGFLKKGNYTLTITFPERGIYLLDNLKILGESTKNVKRKIETLKENVFVNEKIDVNKISGDITLEENKFLCFSIPYSSSWEAYVDGKKVDLLQANTMYMGIELSKGEHHIELRYMTSGLKLGLIISIISQGILFFIFVRNKSRMKR